MRMVFKIVIGLALIYVTVLILVYNVQTKLIFHPTKLSADFRFRNDVACEEVTLLTSDKEKVSALFFSNESDKAILYFHGNAGALDSWQSVYDNFQSSRYNFLLVDYRGYGKSTGEISENGLYSDAQSAYDYLLSSGFKEDQIVIYGRSIGTGVAVDLASRNKCKALILESPYTSLPELASQKIPYLFPSLYIKYKFDNINKINKIRAPLLVIHGKQDGIIPFEHGQKLYDSYSGTKRMISVNEGHHNDLEQFSEVSDGVRAFLEEQRGSSKPLPARP